MGKDVMVAAIHYCASLINMTSHDLIETVSVDEWLEQFLSDKRGEGVPCSDCSACCQSSLFILITPSDKEAKRAIPDQIMFKAPGLPDGYYLMGYDAQGRCPMFKDDQCSIYEARPDTCRRFDCRVLTATNAYQLPEAQFSIANKARHWSFRPDSNAEKLKKIQQAFIQIESLAEKDSEKLIPAYLISRAAMSVEFYELLADTEITEEEKYLVLQRYLVDIS